MSTNAAQFAAQVDAVAAQAAALAAQSYAKAAQAAADRAARALVAQAAQDAAQDAAQAAQAAQEAAQEAARRAQAAQDADAQDAAQDAAQAAARAAQVAQDAQERAADQAAAQVTLGRAARIVQAALGADYWDTDTVTDMGVGIAGRDDAAVWVLGDWNDARTYDAETRTWTVIDDTPSRLLAALERLGVDCWWSDQGAPCPECQKLVDTEPTFGTVDGIWCDGHGYVCLECVALDLEDYIAEYVNNSDKALPDALEGAALEAAGWERTDRDHRSGWYGREDSPAGILTEILEEEGDDLEVVFQITSAHMFELAFTVWTRTPDDADDN